MSARGRRRRANPPYLLDTHIWFWYALGSDRLSSGLRATLDGASADLWLSPVSVWELGLLDERGRVRLADGLRRWVEQALQRIPLREAPLTREVAATARELDLAHRDPADRFLAATALVYELTLVTVDERLCDAQWLPTLSA